LDAIYLSYRKSGNIDFLSGGANMLQNEKGISLIELLIVVAMVSILAAVAGPRLTEYTVQGYNAMAAADLRNAAAAEKAFFADWGVYASSAMVGASGAGSVLTSFTNSTGPIWAMSINGTAPRATIPNAGFSITVSQDTGVVINTSPGGGSFVIVAKNASGDRCFGADSDVKEVYWVNGISGLMLSSSAAPAATAGGNDFSGVISMVPCSGLPGGNGQMMWTVL
jgi:prepilin-type N-terminal cleavage/methylation domain-containing protein